jgi:hypothetical protein
VKLKQLTFVSESPKTFGRKNTCPKDIWLTYSKAFVTMTASFGQESIDRLVSSFTASRQNAFRTNDFRGKDVEPLKHMFQSLLLYFINLPFFTK